MADSDNIPAPCEKEATCEPEKPHPGAARRIRAAPRGYGRTEPAWDYPDRLPDRGENEKLSAGRDVGLSGRKAHLLRQNPDSRHGPDLKLSRRGDCLPPQKDSRKSPTDSPGGVLPMEGITDAVVLLNVLGVVNERGRCGLVPTTKKPLEKAWALDAGFRGRGNASVRRGRLWHEINMREPHLAVNTAETVPFGKTAGPAYAPKLVGRGGGSAPLITSSISTNRPAAASAMPCLKFSGIQESSFSTTNLVTTARSSGGRALNCSMISAALMPEYTLEMATPASGRIVPPERPRRRRGQVVVGGRASRGLGWR